METVLTQITSYLLSQSWQIAVLVMVIAAASLAMKNKSAHVRYLLWLIVLAKCLVPPLLTIPLHILPVSQQTELAPAHRVEMPVVVFEPADTIVSEPVVAPSLIAPVPPEPIIMERLREITIHEWLGFGWIAGVAAFLVFVLTKAMRTNRGLWRKRKPLPAKLQTGIEDFFSELSIRSFPKVWLVDNIGQPFVWGLLRGSIYLPANFARVRSVEHRRSLLMHELSHILRFDAAINVLQIVAQAAFWFHPFVWWANRKLRQEREKCCDEMAIARSNASREDYTRAIINILSDEHELTQRISSLAIARPVKNVEERIKTIMKPKKKFYKRPSIMALVLVLLVGLLTVPTTFALTARQVCEATSSAFLSSLTDAKSLLVFNCETYIVPGDFEIIGGKQEIIDHLIIATGSDHASVLQKMSQECEKVTKVAFVSCRLERFGKFVVIEKPIMLVNSGHVPIMLDGAGLTVTGRVKDSTIEVDLDFEQLEPILRAHQDNKAYEAYTPATTTNDFTCRVMTSIEEPIIIGGLPCDSNKELVLVITPYLVSGEGLLDTLEEDDGYECLGLVDPPRLGIVIGQIRQLREVLKAEVSSTSEGGCIDEWGLDLVRISFNGDNGGAGHFVFHGVEDSGGCLIDHIEFCPGELCTALPLTFEEHASLLGDGTLEPIRLIARDRPVHTKLTRLAWNQVCQLRDILKGQLLLIKSGDVDYIDPSVVTAIFRGDGGRDGQLIFHLMNENGTWVIDHIEYGLTAETKEELVRSTAPPEATDPTELTRLAAEYAERGDFQTAIAYQEKAVELTISRPCYGIGIVVKEIDGVIRVVKLLPNTPVGQFGLAVGDGIEAIDGLSTEDMLQDDAARKIIGPKGTEVTLTVRCVGENTGEDITLIREIPQSPVLGEYEGRLAAYKAGIPYYPGYTFVLLKSVDPAEKIVCEIISLKYTDCESMAETLQNLLERETIDAVDGILDVAMVPEKGTDLHSLREDLISGVQHVDICPVTETNELLIGGKEPYIKMIKALVAAIDVPNFDRVPFLEDIPLFRRLFQDA